MLEDRHFGDAEETRELLGRDRSTDLLDFVCEGHGSSETPPKTAARVRIVVREVVFRGIEMSLLSA